MRKLTIAFLAATALPLSAADLTAQPAARGGVERYDSSVDVLVGAEVKVEKLAEQDGFFGPTAGAAHTAQFEDANRPSSHDFAG